MSELSSRPSSIPSPGREEAPAYGWRGFHLDSARTFWPVEDVLEILELMARYRLNRLSWHLTDDQGWRFAVPGYERLLEISAQLPRASFDNYDNALPAKREALYEVHKEQHWGGFYSDDDIRRVVARAAELGIEVMPEVDLPGHMAAVIAAYPHLGNPALASLPREEWTRNDLLWPTPESYGFLRAALTRVTELFPFSIVHIGGDECRYELWEGDADLMAGAASRGLEGAAQIQGEFTRFARAVLAERGRTIACWDEVTRTPIEGDELVLAWQESVGVPNALATQNPWIYCDADYLYFNRLQGEPESEPCGMWPTITPRQVLEAPIPVSDRLVGVQASVWCEFVTTRELLWYHVFPRLLPFAERAWHGADVLSYEEFEPLLRREMGWLSARGIQGRPLD